MLLQLERPLVFLDFETTGLDIQNDRIVELAFVRLSPDGRREALVRPVNPGVTAMSKGATKVTGIHTNDVCGLFGDGGTRSQRSRCASSATNCWPSLPTATSPASTRSPTTCRCGSWSANATASRSRSVAATRSTCASCSTPANFELGPLPDGPAQPRQRRAPLLRP